MEKFNRAVRRHQISRLKAKRKFYWGQGRVYGREGKVPMDPRRLGQLVQHPQMCSCSGCGNARPWYGRTRKELIHIHDLKEYHHAIV